ncbi:MAG: glutathione S-transferase N-terminal domain-containing protein [Pseudomonadota bacterium]
MFYWLNLTLSAAVSALRLGAGYSPDQTISHEPMPVLYEFEACPFCRITRESISEAGLVVHVKPCPKNGLRYRPDVTMLGGKAQFPFMVNTLTGEGQYESADIARQTESLAGRKRPWVHWLGPINTLSSFYSNLFRFYNGGSVVPSKEPQKPLQYYGSELDPGGRLVKERLSSMELEYIWHPVAKGPKLHDPNTGKDVVGGGRIRKYLLARYAV